MSAEFESAMKWLESMAPQGMVAALVIRKEIERHRQPLEDAFVAGFLVSGEGYNGEHPHDFLDGETLRKELLAPFSEWLSKRQPPNDKG